jgi:hypothetical protein
MSFIKLGLDCLIRKSLISQGVIYSFQHLLLVQMRLLLYTHRMKILEKKLKLLIVMKMKRQSKRKLRVLKELKV